MSGERATSIAPRTTIVTFRAYRASPRAAGPVDGSAPTTTTSSPVMAAGSETVVPYATPLPASLSTFWIPSRRMAAPVATTTDRAMISAPSASPTE